MTASEKSADARWLPPVAAVGGAISTALLVSVAVIELLDTAFSALVGLPLGLLAGVGTLIGILFTLSEIGPVRRRAVLSYAAFGPSVLAVRGLAYVNVGRGLFTVEVSVGVGVAAVAVVYIWLRSVENEPAR